MRAAFGQVEQMTMHWLVIRPQSVSACSAMDHPTYLLQVPFAFTEASRVRGRRAEVIKPIRQYSVKR